MSEGKEAILKERSEYSLRGWAMRLLRERDEARARVKVLEDALWRARDGLRWAKIHLREDAISTAVSMALDQTEATLQEQSK
jgi:hypothetical protein